MKKVTQKRLTPRIIGEGDFRKEKMQHLSTEKSSNSAVTIATIRALFRWCLFTKCAAFSVGVHLQLF